MSTPALLCTIPLDVATCQDLVTSDLWIRKVERDGDCIVWTGPLKGDGYGQVRLNGHKVYVHRVSWVAANDRDLRPGYTVDHVAARGCRSRACVNPEHLDEVTMRENARRAPVAVTTIHAAKTHCAQGHPLAGPDANLVRAQLAIGKRTCRVCALDWTAVRNALRGAACHELGLTQREYHAMFERASARATFDRILGVDETARIETEVLAERRAVRDAIERGAL